MNASELQKAKAEVSATLVDLAEQLEILLTKKGVLPQIEIDIAMQTTRALYNHLLHMQKANASPATVVQPVVEPVENNQVKPEEITKIVQTEVGKLREELFRTFTAPPPPAPQFVPATEPFTKPAPAIEPATSPANVATNTTLAEPVAELVVEAAVEVAPVPQLVVAAAEPVVTMQPEVATPVVPAAQNNVAPATDRTLPPQPVVETPAPDNSLGARLMAKPITNIKASIGINDKFQYLNVLFKGDVGAYNAHIDSLNNCGSFTQANELFLKLQKDYQWDTESTLVTGLFDLVNRRYVN